MSTQVFPTLQGLTFNIERSHEWSSEVMESVSGKETRVAYWSAARYTWKLTFEFLRASTTFSEFQNLWGFYSARQGRYDSFLFQDDTDNTAVGASLGSGDGSNKAFQLRRQFGGSSAINEPILAPNAVTRVTIGGSSVSTSQFTVGAWGSSVPGIITFSTTPGNGVAIGANFTYYFPVRFDIDASSFVEFMSKLWENKSIILKSLK